MLIELLLFVTIILEYHLVRVSSFLLMTLSLGMVHSFPQDDVCQMWCWLILAAISVEITTRNMNYKITKPNEEDVTEGSEASRMSETRRVRQPIYVIGMSDTSEARGVSESRDGVNGEFEFEFKCFIQKMIRTFIIVLFLIANITQIICAITMINGCEFNSLFITISLWCVMIRSILIVPLYIMGQTAFVCLDPNQNYRNILRYIRRQMENIK